MWTDLSMKDKSDLMSLFLKQGISSLSDMKRIYDGTQDIDEEYSGGNINSSKVLFVGDNKKEAKLKAKQAPYSNTGISSNEIEGNNLSLFGKKNYINTFKRTLKKEEKRQSKYLEEQYLKDKINNKSINPEEFGRYIAINRDKTAPYILGTLAGSYGLATGLNALPSIMNSASSIYSLYNNSVLSRLVNTGLTIDGVKNVVSNNGIKKTVNFIKDKNYKRALVSGIGDALDIYGGLGYIKDLKVIPGLKQDFKFLNNFLKDTPNVTTSEKIYNYSRPVLRAISKPFRDITNPVLYKAMLLNAGDSQGVGLINNLLGKNTDIKGVLPISEIKNPIQKVKQLFNNYDNTIYESVHNQHLNDVYGTYLYQNLLWKNPSNLELTTDPIARDVFKQTKGLSRYSDLPIYELGMDNPTTLGNGSSHLVLPPIKYNIKTGKVNVRGTYNKNGTVFRPKESPTQSHFTQVNQDIGGHFIAVRPRKDIKESVFGFPSNFFDVAVKDTQHFTPYDYSKKWKNTSLLQKSALTALDILGDDFNLFGRGVYELYPSWKDPTKVITKYRKDLKTLNSSFIKEK